MMMGELDFSIIDVFEGNVSIGEGLSLDNLFDRGTYFQSFETRSLCGVVYKSVYNISEKFLCFFLAWA